MQAYIQVGPASVDGGAIRSLLIAPRGRRWARFLASATNGGKSHYAVLGVSPRASSADIKKAYRLLALKYHPDVSKDSQADEVFKNIRLAYDILSNERSKNQYDRELRFQEDTGRQSRGNWGSNHEFEDDMKIYNWSDLRLRMQRQKYWESTLPERKIPPSMMKQKSYQKRKPHTKREAPSSKCLDPLCSLCF